MSYILVTGSEGLIGSQLCLSMEKDGRTVRHFDIKFPKNHKDYGDILDLDCLYEKLQNCIGIVHLAAVSRVVWGEKVPEHCWQTNVIGTQNILRLAQDLPLKPWVVYASSREVYGQQQNLPVEIDAEYSPMNIYALSKAAAEEEVLQARKSQLCTAVVRYSSVYGSVYDHKDRVVPAFCRAAVMGSALRIDGLENTLDFTYVDDVAKGTIAIIEALEKGNNELPPVHLTTGVPTTLGALAKLACASAGRELNIVEAPGRTYDVTRFWGNTTKTTQILGWHAETPVETGVSNLVQQFKSLLKV
ncbi:MAG: NAD-dependent epimerase/dehydratase family protein [uncultured bacterium]|nr:MAG: NAD-dependent epimerase/dehydratase family protein [uncultured bacterium]